MLNPLNFISKFIKSSNQKELDRINKTVQKINHLEDTIKVLKDKDFPEFKKFMKTRSTDDDLKKVKYALLKEDGPFTDFNAYIIVNKGENDNESVIQWTARFYRFYKLNPPIPEGQDDATAKAAVQKIVDKGLADLKKALSK